LPPPCAPQRVDKGVVHGFGDHKPFGGNTCLCVVEQPAPDARVHGEIDVGVIEHQIRIVRPQLEHGLFQMLRRLRADMPPGAVAACHRDAANQFVSDDLV